MVEIVLERVQEMNCCEFVYFSIDELTKEFKKRILEEEE